MTYSILYRGPLSSCNYGCNYCPFSKTKNSRAELADDRLKLNRFVSWIASHPQHEINILFTPWGEALIRKYYQDALVVLSHLPNVRRVSIQTNLSCGTAWLGKANKKTITLWTTYHPTEVSMKSFTSKCNELDRLGVRYCVGVVGFKEYIDEVRQLRAAIHSDVYLWVNAYKREQDYYSSADVEAFKKIDHLFEYNTKYYPSEGRRCDTGRSVFSVDGNGDMYRCHFIRTRIGNIYEEGFESNLFERACTNATCGCHIGYIHMPGLSMNEVFGGGALERIPVTAPA
ncbi:STM4011 family radical SAM protein [Chryseolinea sp. T2]|uniref:STM4011 family radical SAM protein n=1 Tax=Chryseolinea sp. T2 TaxID=3129255 RepID=UPI0030784A57